MKKVILTLAFVWFAFGGAVQAQTEDSQYGPKKHGFALSLNFGSGSYVGQGAPQPNLTDYSLSAPMEGWFKNKPVFDLEGKFFITEKWALKLTGGLFIGYNPGYKATPGTAEQKGGELPPLSGDIPNYDAVASKDNIQYSVALGFDRYITTVYDRVFLRVGAEFGFAYGRVSQNAADDERYMGTAIGEAYSFRVLPVVGVDYFFAKQWFVGMDIKPLSYHYSVFSERPQVGMKLLSSDNHSFSFLRQTPSIKLGFRF